MSKHKNILKAAKLEILPSPHSLKPERQRKNLMKNVLAYSFMKKFDSFKKIILNDTPLLFWFIKFLKTEFATPFLELFL